MMYGEIVIFGAWNTLCICLDRNIHVLQARSGRELLISPRRVGLA